MNKGIVAVDFQPTSFGFKWGALEVSRTASIDGRVIVTLKTPHDEITVYASRTGRSLRAFHRNQHEMIAPAPPEAAPQS